MPGELPPGPDGFVGLNAFNWTFRPAPFWERATAQYGDIWSLRLAGGEQWVLVSRPALVEEIFRADPTVLHGGEGNNIARPLVGPHSLLVIDEEEHAAQRKLLRPFLYGERLDRYPELIASICEQEISRWPMNEPFGLQHRLEGITVKVIMNVIFGLSGPEGTELYARARQLMAYGENRLRMMKFYILAGKGKVPKSFVAVRNPFDKQIYREIERARQDPNLPERDDVLAILVQMRHDDGTRITDQELRDHLVTLLMQGHQTTGTALAWAFERLMRNPEALDRLRAEAETDSDEYLDAVIKETLRMRPPLPVTMRKVMRPYRLGEYELDPGVRLAVMTYQVHRRPELYPDPERFRPERFFEEPGKSAMWIPFGGGERHCIGRTFSSMVMKIVLRTIALQTRLKPANPAAERVKHSRVQIVPSEEATAIIVGRNPDIHTDLTPFKPRSPQTV